MMRFHIRPSLLWAAVLTLSAAVPAVLPVRAGALCVGDCDGNGQVSIAEAQACVNLASDLPAPPCAAADQNLDGHVDVNEVDDCIQGFLDSSTCPLVFTPGPTSTVPANTPVPTNTHPPNTNTPAPTSTRTPAATSTNTPPPTNTASAVPTATLTVTRTFTPAPPTATATKAPTCPLAAGAYTITQVSGGTLRTYTFAPFAFPAGGTILEDVSAASPPDCVHDVVVPFPGGFSSPNFCVPALGFTVSVTQTACGIGKVDSNGGSDFTISEIADTSDSSPTCNLPNPGCPPGPPVFAKDASSRVDVTVGDGVVDTCTSGTANSLVTVPVHTKSWSDTSGGTFGMCPGNGVLNPGDVVVAEFDQILDFTSDTASAKWMDIDGDGCSIAGSGPAAGFTATGTCIDLTKLNTASTAVTTVATGTFGATGGLDDGSFTTKLPATLSGPAAPLGATCSPAPVINFTGMATRCIH
jgi:hypothetical protein